MTRPQPVKHSTLQIHDTVRVFTTYEDTTSWTVGVIERRYMSGRSTVYETAKGVELLMAHPDGSATKGNGLVTKIMLVSRNPHPTLFD